MKARRFDLYAADWLAGLAGHKLGAAAWGVYKGIILIAYDECRPTISEVEIVTRLSALMGEDPRTIKAAIRKLERAGKVVRTAGEIEPKKVRDQIELAESRVRSAAERGAKGGRISGEVRAKSRRSADEVPAKSPRSVGEVSEISERSPDDLPENVVRSVEEPNSEHRQLKDLDEATASAVASTKTNPNLHLHQPSPSPSTPASPGGHQAAAPAAASDDPVKATATEVMRLTGWRNEGRIDVAVFELMAAGATRDELIAVATKLGLERRSEPASPRAYLRSVIDAHRRSGPVRLAPAPVAVVERTDAAWLEYRKRKRAAIGRGYSPSDPEWPTEPPPPGTTEGAAA